MTTTTTSHHRPLVLFPELYRIISSHLPLYVASTTLLALALTNHYHASVVIPILRSCLVLKSEEDAFTVLKQLNDDSEPPLTFGSLVREIHILASLSVATRTQTPPLDVVRRVEDVILAGRVPILHTLCIQLTHGWHSSWHWTTGPIILDGLGRFSKNFFPRMQQTACPRLKCLVLEGFRDYPSRPWVEDSGVYRLSNMTHLLLNLNETYETRGGIIMSEDTLTSIANSLPELYLTLIPGSGWTRTAPAYLSSLDFPRLRSLTITNDWVQRVPPSSSMAFLAARHATLEHLEIASSSDPSKVIIEHNIPEGFFPKLRHLSAGIKDVERLPLPVLGQLVSLKIERGVNHQLSGLFDQIQRSLPSLKSLAISLNNELHEIWLRGLPNFHDQPSTCTMGELMNSIARATPNLEELAFFQEAFPLSQFVSISQELNALPKLSHIYYTEYQTNMLTDENQDLRERFSEQVKDVAEAVIGLRYITHIHPVFRPYLTARILRNRDEDGGGVSVLVREGYGMKYGYDNGALPWGPV